MDERGGRTFGDGDGELTGLQARRIREPGEKIEAAEEKGDKEAVRAVLREYKPKPVVGMGDAAVLCLFLAACVALAWWLL